MIDFALIVLFTVFALLSQISAVILVFFGDAIVGKLWLVFIHPIFWVCVLLFGYYFFKNKQKCVGKKNIIKVLLLLFLPPIILFLAVGLLLISLGFMAGGV